MGEQAGPDAALGDRLGRQGRLGDLRVVALRLARPAGVGGADQFADEDRHRLVVEAFADALADADLEPCRSTHRPSRRRSGRSLPGDAAGPSACTADRGPSASSREALRGSAARPASGPRRRAGSIPSKRVGPSTRSPPRPKVDLHQAMDVGLLRFDLLAKFGHHAAQFRDHGFRVGQLLAKVVGVVGRRHARIQHRPAFRVARFTPEFCSGGVRGPWPGRARRGSSPTASA